MTRGCANLRCHELLCFVIAFFTFVAVCNANEKTHSLGNKKGFVHYQLYSGSEICVHNAWRSRGFCFKNLFHRRRNGRIESSSVFIKGSYWLRAQNENGICFMYRNERISWKEVSSKTLKAHKEFCSRLKMREKRQTASFPVKVPEQQSIRDIAANGAGIESILGSDGRGAPLIFPDTKWCGEGTIATSFDDLGKERLADMCCRAHDKCPKAIRSSVYHPWFDLKNPVAYAVSDCACDDEFRRCLDANKGRDWVSSLIKDIFQNVLKTPCMKFMHPLKCVKHQKSTDDVECNTYEYDKSRPEKWFIIEHPRDSDTPVRRDACGRCLEPKRPTFAERDTRVETPDRAYTFDMVSKADFQAEQWAKLSQLRALMAEHRARRARNPMVPTS